MYGGGEEEGRGGGCSCSTDSKTFFLFIRYRTSLDPLCILSVRDSRLSFTVPQQIIRTVHPLPPYFS